MKKIIIAAFILLSLKAIAQDQNKKNPGEKQMKEQQAAQASADVYKKAIEAGMKTPMQKKMANEPTADEKANAAEAKAKANSSTQEKK